MKFIYTLVTVIFLAAAFTVRGQNVGVGTTTPDEKLDVNGNIHMRGNLKVNGSFGSDGQVLMNSGGNTGWANIADSYKSEFKNFATYAEAGDYSWVAPAGVTKIMIEAWGGGGGGISSAGGGGGAYIMGVAEVSAGGTVSILVGAGGIAGAANGATSGGRSNIRINTSGYQFSAAGGSAAWLSSYTIRGAGGWFYAYPAANRQYSGMPGQTGELSSFRFERQDETTTFLIYEGGRGGDAGNTKFTGGAPRIAIKKILPSSSVAYTVAPKASHPGGGGGGGSLKLVSGDGAGLGGEGADGMVIIYW